MDVLHCSEGTDFFVVGFHGPLELGAYVALDEIDDFEPSGKVKPVPIRDLLTGFRRKFRVWGGVVWGSRSLPQSASGDKRWKQSHHSLCRFVLPVIMKSSPYLIKKSLDEEASGFIWGSVCVRQRGAVAG